MKILMSAYSCEPGKGSEPGIGWNTVREAARYHEVWVLTRPDESREAIEAELARNPVPNLHFVYFTLPFWKDSLRWGQAGAMQLHHYLWQIQAYFEARRLHQEIGFDLVHHVTFAKHSSPSFLSLLPIPFVWGPVAGGEVAPKAFWQDFSPRAKLYELARDLFRIAGELDPFVRLTARRSAIIQATTEDTAQQLYKMGVDQVQIMPAIGLPEADIARLAQCKPPGDSPVRFVSMGRLLHWKGFHLGLRAFAKANLPDAEYWVIGDGPERQPLEALAQELGIAQRTKFWGSLPREQTLGKLEDCHALVHPSLHDSGGWVCLESMAAGRPVICLDLSGPAVLVSKDAGLRIPAHSPDQAVSDLAAAMTQIAQDAELRTRMAQVGQQLVRETLSWRARGEHMAQIYAETVSKGM